MTYKKLLWSLLAIIVIWSCGKDDDPVPPAAPTIANFSPTSGPVGTTITINGTNFSTTNASNTVKVGTATAQVTAATATKITATVPQGATTGKVSVTVGTQTATSTNDFTVTVPNADDPDGDDPDGDDPDGDDPDGDDPTNEAPTAENQDFEVAEDIVQGDVIGTATATDADEDELTFALLTDESELFQVAENGEISLAEKNLDFENAPEHTLTLTVSDGSNDPVQFTVTVTVTDVDEAPMAENQEFTVPEDIGMDEVIGTVEATDPEGDELTFTLTENDNDLFAVSNAGEITLAEGKNLDFETKPTHSLTLEVSDGTNDPVEFTVTVNVTDVDDLPLAEDPASFIMKFTVTDGQTLFIGTNTDYDYDFTIDWGDGTVQENVTEQNPSHDYETGGTYTVAIKGTFPALRMWNADTSSRDALVDVAQWGAQQWQSMASTFRDCNNLVAFSAPDAPDLSETGSMQAMFLGAGQFNGVIGHWVTSKVTDMRQMFQDAASFNQPLDWDTSSVTDMSDMFANTGGNYSFNQPLDWDTSSVTDMVGMFVNTGGGSHAFNQPLDWDTSSVTDMTAMFANLEGGSHAFNQSLGAWDISSVEIMGAMLYNSAMSPENYENTLLGWATQNSIPQGIELGAEFVTYCNDFWRNILINQHGWSISDGGEDPNCP